jgi:alpha-L-rhamnosidase
LRAAIVGDGVLADVKYIPDSFDVDGNGTLRAKGYHSEAAMYTALWSGLLGKGEAPALDRAIVEKMGPAPVYARDPMVGTSNLFIGLCIRLDMLCRMGAYDKMYEDMLAIYMPQLTEGPGTLWENAMIDTSSRCHGFAAHAGVHLIRDVLGLGIPAFTKNGEGERCVMIAPHICGLRWARGTHETPDGLIALEWKYDGESFVLNGSLPAGYTHVLALPREVIGLSKDRVKINITTRG